MEGRVEVCYGNKWGGICSPNHNYWGMYEASAVCRQLGFYPYDAITFNKATLESDPLPITLMLNTVIIVQKDFLTATIMNQIITTTTTLLPHLDHTLVTMG